VGRDQISWATYIGVMLTEKTNQPAGSAVGSQPTGASTTVVTVIDNGSPSL
jgi:hypothetical protein